MPAKYNGHCAAPTTPATAASGKKIRNGSAKRSVRPMRRGTGRCIGGRGIVSKGGRGSGGLEPFSWEVISFQLRHGELAGELPVGNRADTGAAAKLAPVCPAVGKRARPSSALPWLAGASSKR